MPETTAPKTTAPENDKERVRGTRSVPWCANAQLRDVETESNLLEA